MDYKISVIIPTYKRSLFLTRAVNSVLSQTYKNIEVIIVDDNGKDSEFSGKTMSVIKKEYDNDERVVYVQNDENIGGAKSRNKGVKLSSGKYLCFLDDDDIYLPDKLEKQSQFMERNGLELSLTDIKMYDDNDRLVDFRDHSKYITSCDNDSLLKNHIMHHLTPTDSYMFSRDGFFKTGGFHTRAVSQEFMLMLDSILEGLKIGYLQGVYAIQYVHSGERISQAQKRVEGDKALYEVKKQYFDRLDKKEIRFINFRSNIVLAVYFMRNKKPIQFIKFALKSFFISPVYFVKEGISMAVRLKKDK